MTNFTKTKQNNKINSIFESLHMFGLSKPPKAPFDVFLKVSGTGLDLKQTNDRNSFCFYFSFAQQMPTDVFKTHNEPKPVHSQQTRP